MSSLFVDTDVIELDDDDFDMTRVDPYLKIQEPGMIMFYSATCPHCISKREIYSELAKLLNNKPGYQIYSVHVNDPHSKKISQRLEIMFIPTFYESGKSGELEKYEGDFGQKEFLERAKKVTKTLQIGQSQKTSKKKAPKKKQKKKAKSPKKKQAKKKAKSSQMGGGKFTCVGTKKNGDGCLRQVTGEEEYCWQHSSY